MEEKKDVALFMISKPNRSSFGKKLCLRSRNVKGREFITSSLGSLNEDCDVLESRFYLFLRYTKYSKRIAAKNLEVFNLAMLCIASVFR